MVENMPDEELSSSLSSSTTGKGWKRMLPGLVISLICLAIVISIVDPRQLGPALALADFRLISFGILTSLSWLLVRGLVWRTLLQDRASYTQVFLAVNEGYLLNNILPFRLGEVGRAFLLSRKANLEFWQVFSTILIERILDVAMTAGLLLSTLPFIVGASWANEAALAAAGLVLVGLGVLFMIARQQERVTAIFTALGKRWPLIEKTAVKRLPAFFTGLSALTDGRLFLKTLGFMLLNWGIIVIQQYTLLRAFFPQARLVWATFSLSVSALGLAAPSSPGGIGVMELSLVGALAFFGLDNTTSFAFAIIVHLFNYLLSGIIGSYALTKDGESLIGVYHKLSRLRLSAHG